MIEEYYEVSKDGDLLPPDWNKSNVGESFKVIPIIGAQWRHQGKLIRKLYAYSNPLSLIPN